MPQYPRATFTAPLSCPHLSGSPPPARLPCWLSGKWRWHIVKCSIFWTWSKKLSDPETVTHFLSCLLKSVSEKLLSENVSTCRRTRTSTTSFSCASRVCTETDVLPSKALHPHSLDWVWQMMSLAEWTEAQRRWPWRTRGQRVHSQGQSGGWDPAPG